jgi:hypothetical protein
MNFGSCNSSLKINMLWLVRRAGHWDDFRVCHERLFVPDVMGRMSWAGCHGMLMTGSASQKRHRIKCGQSIHQGWPSPHQ